MKDIKIGKNVEDKREAIEKALEEIQKRCTARTIDFDDVKKALEMASENCPIQTKTIRAGIRFSIDPNGQSFPNAYRKKGRPVSTVISGEFCKTGLKISFARDDTHSTRLPAYSHYTREQAFEVLMHAGCEVSMLNRAVNLYENQTKNKVFYD